MFDVGLVYVGVLLRLVVEREPDVALRALVVGRAVELDERVVLAPVDRVAVVDGRVELKVACLFVAVVPDLSFTVLLEVDVRVLAAAERVVGDEDLVLAEAERVLALDDRVLAEVLLP